MRPRPSNLPERLHAAYDWVAAQKGLNELRALRGAPLHTYISEACANYFFLSNEFHATTDILIREHLWALHRWLKSESGA